MISILQGVNTVSVLCILRTPICVYAWQALLSFWNCLTSPTSTHLHSEGIQCVKGRGGGEKLSSPVWHCVGRKLW